MSALHWIYLSTGFTGLLYEVLWTRRLSLIFGGAPPAVGCALAAYMGALALGAEAARRVRPRPLPALAALQAFIGLHALASPWLFSAVQRGYLALAPDLPGPGLAALELAAAFVLIGPPCLAMGACLPALSAVFGEDSADSGLLWGLNTAAGAAGALAGGFVFLPLLGLKASGWAAASLSLAASAAALKVRDRWNIAKPRRDAAAGLQGLGPAALAAGAGLFMLEAAWTRALTLVLGASIHAFSLMLCAFLLGLGLGGLWAWKRPVLFRRLRTGAAFLLGAAAVAAWLGVFIAPRLPFMYLLLFKLSGPRPLLLDAAGLALSLFALLPAAFFLGAFLPQCFWTLAAGEAAGPATVGRLTALHGLGGVAGALAASFWILPHSGLRGCILASAALLWLGAAELLATGSRGLWGAAKALATFGLAGAAAGLLSPAWKPGALSGGIYLAAPKVLETLERPSAGALFARLAVFHKEGALADVFVSDRLWLSPGPERSLAIDGKVDASTERDMPTQALMAHLPLIFGGARGDVFLAGLASGVTAGEALRHPIASLTVAEIEPAVVEASHWFEPFNGRPLSDPRTRLLAEDARAALARSSRRYHAILSQPSNPWQAGSARLFTREYFELARSRLEPGGVFGLWLQDYALAPERLRLALRTLLAVFPEAALFETAPGDLVLVASEQPLELDDEALKEGFERVRESLVPLGLADEWALLARRRLGAEALRRFARTGPLNTDDNALLEFSAGRDLMSDTAVLNSQALRAAADDPLEALLDWAPEDAAALSRAQLEDGLAERAEASARAALELRPLPEGVAALAAALRAQGRAKEAEEELAAGLRRWKASPSLALEAARSELAAGRSAQALARIRALPPELRGSPQRRAAAAALWGLGRCAEAKGELEDAADGPDEEDEAALYGPDCGLAPEARAALGRMRERWAWLKAADAEARERALLEGSPLKGPGLERLKALAAEELAAPSARLRSALGLAALGRWKKAAGELGGLAKAPGEAGLLALYYEGVCLGQAGDREAARARLTDFVRRAAPGHPEDFRLALARRELTRTGLPARL